MNISIVRSSFNGEITSRMLAVAREKAAELGVNISHVIDVPGVYDMPLAVDKLLARSDTDAVVTIGAVIRGQTKHDELIAHATAKALLDISVRHGKPVSLGVTGPGMRQRQAYARIRPAAERAVSAAVRMNSVMGSA